MLVAGGMLEQFQRQWKQWGQVAGPTEWGHTFGCFDSKWSFMLFRSGTCSMSIGTVIAQEKVVRSFLVKIPRWHPQMSLGTHVHCVAEGAPLQLVCGVQIICFCTWTEQTKHLYLAWPTLPPWRSASKEACAVCRAQMKHYRTPI